MGGKYSREKGREEFYGKGKTCENCMYFTGKEEAWGQTIYQCALTNAILTGKPCDLYNIDISKWKICYNCKHFLGGGDWGLACAKHYRYLPEALTKACEDMERKERKPT